MKIQPIKNESQYDLALAEVDRLWGSEPDTPNGDKLDIWLMLVEKYEETHHPIAPPDPVAALLFRMDQMNLTRKDLEPMIGSRARVSEVLNRRRSLSLPMIRNLHQGLHLPLESLVMDTRHG